MKNTMPCPDAKRGLNITNALFGSIAAISLLVTLILLGDAMDKANFPGSNLLLDKNGLEFVNATKGFEVGEPAACSNMLNADVADPAAPLPFVGAAKGLCKASDAANALNNDWSEGWIVAPDCKREDDDETACAPFNMYNPLALSGATMFGSMAMLTLVFGATTCVSLLDGHLTMQALKDVDARSKAYLALNVVWLIVGFSLFAASAMGWLAFCDKIDTGLGRKSDNEAGTPVQACALSTCERSFSEQYVLFAVSLFWYRIPNVVAWADPNLEMVFRD
jgi:hypothetical protein